MRTQWNFSAPAKVKQMIYWPPSGSSNIETLSRFVVSSRWRKIFCFIGYIVNQCYVSWFSRVARQQRSYWNNKINRYYVVLFYAVLRKHINSWFIGPRSNYRKVIILWLELHDSSEATSSLVHREEKWSSKFNGCGHKVLLNFLLQLVYMEFQSKAHSGAADSIINLANLLLNWIEYPVRNKATVSMGRYKVTENGLMLERRRKAYAWMFQDKVGIETLLLGWF